MPCAPFVFGIRYAAKGCACGDNCRCCHETCSHGYFLMRAHAPGLGTRTFEAFPVPMHGLRQPLRTIPKRRGRHRRYRVRCEQCCQQFVIVHAVLIWKDRGCLSRHEAVTAELTTATTTATSTRQSRGRTINLVRGVAQPVNVCHTRAHRGCAECLIAP